jgi:hypothetical protein
MSARIRETQNKTATTYKVMAVWYPILIQQVNVNNIMA